MINERRSVEFAANTFIYNCFSFSQTPGIKHPGALLSEETSSHKITVDHKRLIHFSLPLFYNIINIWSAFKTEKRNLKNQKDEEIDRNEKI